MTEPFNPQQPFDPSQQPQQPPQGYQPPPGYQPLPVPGSPEDGKVMAIVAYLIFFIPLITGDASRNQFVRFHTNQGLVLFLTGFASSIVSMILLFIPVLGWIIIALLPLAILALVILGIVNAAQLTCRPLPLIGQITLLK